MNQRHFRAPLNFESQRFFRGVKTVQRGNLPLPLLKTILLGLYVYFLLAIDLILFTDSGNLNVFRGEWLISPEVLILLVFLLIFTFAVMTASFFVCRLQKLICILCTFWFVIVLFNQFAQFNTKSFLGEALHPWLGSMMPAFFYTASDITMAFILSAAASYFFFRASLKVLFIYTAMFFIAFAGIIRYGFNRPRHTHDFIETSRPQITAEDKQEGEKFIYIMLPNLMSYKYFLMDDYLPNKEISELMTGFYAKNNFEIFPDAYHESNDLFMNMVESVNSVGGNAPQQHITNTMMVDRYWNFFNINDEHIFLKDNQMFDMFRKAGYKISVYKSRGFDMCHKNHQFNVDRCVEKLNRPVNFYSMHTGRFARAKLLLFEWLSSMKILKNLSKPYQALNMFTHAENLPMIGVNYNNLYVLNSAKTFDVLAEDIITDQGRQAYFVYADIPSDMFVYDQYCRIKPQDEWISLDDFPWINVDKSSLKRTAYIDQAKCLYGKLQEFLDKLDSAGVLQKSVIVLEGMSSVQNFKQQNNDTYVNRFIYNKLTTLAILSPLNTQLMVNTNLCPAKDLVNTYLYQTQTCDGIESMNIHQSIKEGVLNKLNMLEISEQQMNDNHKIFEDWYNQWRQMNKADNESNIHIIYNEKNREHISDDTLLPELKNETLQ